MLILVIDTRKIYINTDTTPKESKVVYVQLGSSLTQVEIGLTQVEIGLTQVEIGLTQVEIGLTRVEIGLTQVEIGVGLDNFNNFNIPYEVLMLILVIDTRKIYINTDTTPKESKVVYVQLGSSLTQVEIGLTQVEIGLTRVEIGLTRVEIGLTQVEIVES